MHIILVFPDILLYLIFNSVYVCCVSVVGGLVAVVLPLWRGIKASGSVVEASWSVVVWQGVSVEAAWVYM